MRKEILTRIEENRYEFIKNTGIIPTVIFLGKREKKKLIKEMKKMAIYKSDISNFDGFDHIFGMKIKETGDSSYLGFGILVDAFEKHEFISGIWNIDYCDEQED